MSKVIFPGTFDPATNGHIELLYRAATLFPEVVIAITTNTNKTPLFPLTDRIEMMSRLTCSLSNVTIISFDGLMVDCAKKINANTIIRGLRPADFHYEFQLATLNRTLAPEIDTVFLSALPDNIAISSSMVKEIAKYGGDVSSMVDPIVKEFLDTKF